MAAGHVDPAIPRTLRAAITILYVYAAFVLVIATVYQVTAGWADGVGYFRAVARGVGVVFLATQLGKGARWAWYTCLALGGLWFVVGGAIIGMLVILGSESLAAGEADVPALRVAASVVSYVLVVAALFLLLHRDTRAAFARPEA